MLIVCKMLRRRSVKSRARTEVGQSVEDARIWATDMSPGHYEKINMQSVASGQYESIRNMQTQVREESYGVSRDYYNAICQVAEYPPPPSDASDVDAMLAHQNVIASSHPDGSYFMTQEGQSLEQNTS